MQMPTTAASRKRVTLVIPARNEEANIPRLERELCVVVDALPYDFEFVVIDNASLDRTGVMVKEICQRDPRWKYVRFSRDFSVEMSLAAGYHFAQGDAVIVIDSDLQDPPQVIPRFLEKWEEGYDVVYGVRTVRPGDPTWRNLSVKVFYRLIASLADVKIPTDTGNFRLISRRVRDALEQIGEYNRYMRGLIAWIGFKQIGIVYERQPRLAGESKGPFWNIFFYALNAITSFSLKPLRLFLLFGGFLIIASMFGILLTVILYFIGHPVPGLTTLFVLSFLAIGVNSLGIGILGEYLGRTYLEVKRRPLYLIDEAVGIELSDMQRAAQDVMQTR